MGYYYTRPVHKHDLRIRKKKEEIPDQMSHWCATCDFYLHETCAKLALEIKHFFHPHPLFLWTVSGFTCNSCFGRRSEVFVYHCERCDFDMCLECTAQSCEGETGKEQVLHCCHRHPLQPLQVKPNSLLSCQICDMPGPTWGCEPCNFLLHKPCLDFLPEVVQINFRCQAASWVLKTSTYQRCNSCHKSIHPQSLGFREMGEDIFVSRMCIFCCLALRLIEESSSNVPKVINHSIQPCPDDLKLILSPASSKCNACLLSHHPFSYHCDSCDFFLCLDCAQRPHLFHWHPLTLLTERNDTRTCHLCEKNCSEPFYSCIDQCQFFVHKSCMDYLPHRTSHLLLNTIVVLLHVHSFECTTCNFQCLGLAYYYSGRKCLFCVKCVLSPQNVAGDDRRFISILHWHQLSLCETRPQHKRRRCFLCNELCIPWTLTYKCGECNFFFHKSCAELSAKLEHPIHPQHPLALTNRTSSLSNEDMICKLCLKSLSQSYPLYDLVYQCHQCDFQLDTQCAANCLPSVEYKGHSHLLHLVVNMHGNTNCRVCNESCKGSCTFRCAESECDFNLHLQCGPLPHTVKHVCHVHPLILKDYYVEDNVSDQFACHVCEEERDPRLRVYHCSRDCLMICDVKCVLNEVLPLLRGEHGEVELRTPFSQIECRVINNKSGFGELKLDFTIEGARDGIEKTKDVFSFSELVESDCDSEKEESDKLSSESWKEDESSNESSITSTNLDEEANNYSFSWKALSHFEKSLRALSDDYLEDDFLRRYEGDIMIGAYALPEILDPIYKEFFGMYNIIDHKCKLRYKKKCCLVFVTISVQHQMRKIKVVDVTKEIILRWLEYIRFVEEEGKFNVGFVAKNIKQVWKAHYYIQAKKIVDDKTQRLERELEQVSMYEAELRTKMDEAKARHHELKLMAEEHDAYTIVGARGPMKKVRSEALEIKWRTCYESLVTYPGNAPAK